MKILSLFQTVGAVATALTTSLPAAAIFAPGDPIVGGQSDGTTFTAGIVGFPPNVNAWPPAEPPAAAIDGVGQKYLNFGVTNTGVLVTPTFNEGNGSVVTSIKLWAANDVPPRDPASFELWGTNSPIDFDADSWSLSDFTAIETGLVTLPDSRNPGGGSPLDDLNSQTISFANSESYTSYLVVFPEVKNSTAGGNAMQVAEIQLYGAIPEPSIVGLFGMSAFALVRRRRKI